MKLELKFFFCFNSGYFFKILFRICFYLNAEIGLSSLFSLIPMQYSEIFFFLVEKKRAFLVHLKAIFQQDFANTFLKKALIVTNH